MAISFMYYKGKKILYCDYSHCKTAQESISFLEEVKSFYLSLNEKVLCLNNFTGVPSSNEFMDISKKYAKEFFDSKNMKEACIGLSGLQKIMLAGYNLVVKQKMYNFDSKDEALEYLIK